MKKRFLFIPLLIITLLMSCITMSASAEGAVEYSSGLDTYYDTPEQLLTYMSNRYHVTVSDYIYIKYYNVNSYSNEQNQYMYKSALLYSNGDITVSENNGVYTFNSTSSFYYAECMTLALIGGGSDSIGSKEYSVPELGTQIIYDSNSPDFLYSSYGYSVASSSLLYGSLYNEILDVEYDLDGVQWSSNGLNVSVEFNPSFSGEIDRASTLANGVVTYDDLFNFNVINHSSTGIQWYMAIVEHGYNVSFLDPFFMDYGDLRGADLTVHNNNIKYIFLRQEDVFLDNPPDYIEAHCQSSMHYVAANSESGLNLCKWDMVNLQKNHTYDVVVYAVLNEASKTSFVSSGGAALYHSYEHASIIDFGTIEEVYRSSFSVKNPAVYNKDSSIGGSIANDNDTDYDDLTKTLYSYKGLDDDGNPSEIFGTFKYGQDIYDLSDWGNSGSYSSYGSSSSGKFNSLLTQTSAAFGFFTTILRMFPGQLYTILGLGFFALIIVAIVKKVT